VLPPSATVLNARWWGDSTSMPRLAIASQGGHLGLIRLGGHQRREAYGERRRRSEPVHRTGSSPGSSSATSFIGSSLDSPPSDAVGVLLTEELPLPFQPPPGARNLERYGLATDGAGLRVGGLATKQVEAALRAELSVALCGEEAPSAMPALHFSRCDGAIAMPNAAVHAAVLLGRAAALRSVDRRHSLAAGQAGRRVDLCTAFAAPPHG
jgi:hypothetical protein